MSWQRSASTKYVNDWAPYRLHFDWPNDCNWCFSIDNFDFFKLLYFEKNSKVQNNRTQRWIKFWCWQPKSRRCWSIRYFIGSRNIFRDLSFHEGFILLARNYIFWTFSREFQSRMFSNTNMDSVFEIDFCFVDPDKFCSQFLHLYFCV